MLILPKTVGSYSLQRKLGTGGVAESYLAVGPGGRPAVVRRALPWITRDASRFASFEARLADLTGARHPFLVPVTETFRADDDVWFVEDHVDGVSLERVLAWCRQQGRTIPPNVFLNVATHVCNALEALHGRTGRGTAAEHVLHLSVKPRAIFLTRDGKVVVGSYGLVRSPTLLPSSGAAGPAAVRMEYVSPEQAEEDQRLTPATDLFSLGAVLYEALTLSPLFRAGSNVQTLERIRSAELGGALSAVRERMPGLDKVLGRALALQPRHRYQRAFVLREDLRGLMSGYSFASIADDTRAFVAPLLGPAPQRAATDEERTENTAPRFEPYVPPAPRPLEADPPTLHAIEVEEPSTSPRHAMTGAGSGHDASAPVRRLSDERTLTGNGDNLLDQRHSLALGLLDTTAARIDDADLLEAVQLPETTAAYVEPPPEVRAWRADDGGPPTEVSTELPAFPATHADTAAFLAAELPQAGGPQERHGNALDTTSAHLAAEPALLAGSLENTAAHLAIGDIPIVRETLPIAPVAAVPMQAAPAEPPAFPRPLPPAPVVDVAPLPVTPSAAPAVTAPTTSSAPAGPPAHTEPPPPWTPEPYAAPPPRGRRALVIGGALAAAALAVAVVVLGSAAERPASTVADAEPANDTVNAAPPRLEPIDEAAPAPAPDPVAEGSAPPAGPPAEGATRAADTQADRSSGPSRPPEAGGAKDAPSADAAPERTPTVVQTAGAQTRTAPEARASGAASTRSRTTSRAVDETEPAAARITPAIPSAAARARPPEPLPDDADTVADADLPELDLDDLSDDAQRGQLTRSDVSDLESIPSTSPDYSRSRRILLTHAQRRSDDAGTRRYLDDLFVLGENRYDPVLLTVEARWLVNARRYDDALAKAELAERNWARIPSEQVFSKKAEIYEVQAAATQGRFYDDPDNVELLSGAIRAWERYRAHVLTKSRNDLAAKADAQVAKLDSVRERME